MYKEYKENISIDLRYMRRMAIQTLLEESNHAENIIASSEL